MSTSDSTAVSVITVTRNHESGLRRTLASVRSQDWRYIEHVVVDGASSDGTVRFLEEAGAESGLKWVSEPDRGIYDAMNKGLALSTGQLVIFLNAGDTFTHAGVVARICNDFRPSAWRWGYGCSRLLDENHYPVAAQAFTPFRLDRLALGLSTVPHQAVCMQKTLLQELGGFRIETGLAADQELLYRAAIVSPPRVWVEFFVDFEGGGVGSRRQPAEFVWDMRKVRRRTSTSVGPGPVDLLISAGIASGRVLLHGQTRVRKRLGLHGSGATKKRSK